MSTWGPWDRESKSWSVHMAVTSGLGQPAGALALEAATSSLVSQPPRWAPFASVHLHEQPTPPPSPYTTCFRKQADFRNVHFGDESHSVPPPSCRTEGLVLLIKER